MGVLTVTNPPTLYTRDGQRYPTMLIVTNVPWRHPPDAQETRGMRLLITNRSGPHDLRMLSGK